MGGSYNTTIIRLIELGKPNTLLKKKKNFFR